MWKQSNDFILYLYQEAGQLMNRLQENFVEDTILFHEVSVEIFAMQYVLRNIRGIKEERNH